MNVLGINAYHGDSSACLLVDGVVRVAIEEERLRRIKHWAGFPSEAIRGCLEQTGLAAADIDHVAIGRDPSANLLSKIAYTVRRRPGLSLIRDRCSNLGKIRELRTVLCEALEIDPARCKARLHHVEHHLAHVASSYYPSGFEEAVCVSMDGFGDFASTMWAIGSGGRIRVVQRVLFPHSLGVLYTAGTQFLGFSQFGDEYKVMGLASYGRPEYVDTLGSFVKLEAQGRFRLESDLFRHPDQVVDTRWDGCAPETANYFAEGWVGRLGPARAPGEPLTPRHESIASSLQSVFEDVYFHALDHASTLHPSRNLCLAGGSAFNSVANGKITERTAFDRFHIHPAAGDAGIAVGAAYWVWHHKLAGPRVVEREDPYLGPSIPSEAIRAALRSAGLDFEWLEDEEERIRRTVARLVAGDVVGWFQGRAEWGPRALGNRSILVDPRRPEAREILNARVKRRESFRPFAPAVLEERAGEIFERHEAAPFMNQVYPVLPVQRGLLPAVTHVDGTARLQTVSRTSNRLFHRLIEAFAEETGIPVLLNTSFNENEPIVHTPEEAIRCLVRTGMDTLVLGPAMVVHSGGPVS